MMEFKYKIKFFGQRTQRIPLDGIVSVRKNLWRAKVKVKGYNDLDCDPPHVRMRSSGQTYFPPDSYSEHSFHMESNGNRADDVLVWCRKVHRSDLGDMELVMRFNRVMEERSGRESKK